MKYNDVRYATYGRGAQTAPAYRHAVRVDPATLFASGLQPPADVAVQFRVEQNDLRLSAKSTAVDKGIAIPGINDDFSGKSPDLGAYELGVPPAAIRPADTVKTSRGSAYAPTRRVGRDA